MAYPTGDQFLPQKNSSMRVEPYINYSISQSGVIRFADMGAVDHTYIRVVVGALTETDRDTYLSWISTNLKSEVTDLPYGSDTYTGYILPDGVQVTNWRGAPHLFQVAYQFRGVKN